MSLYIVELFVIGMSYMVVMLVLIHIVSSYSPALTLNERRFHCFSWYRKPTFLSYGPRAIHDHDKSCNTTSTMCVCIQYNLTPRDAPKTVTMGTGQYPSNSHSTGYYIFKCCLYKHYGIFQPSRTCS